MNKHIKDTDAKLVIHAGDLSYANSYQPTWKKWLNMVQPIAQNVPYMVCPGNHETLGLFIPFLKRFTMPYNESHAIEGNMFYSFDFANIHFISLSSENFEFWHFLPQYQWLKNDLKKVDRKKTPWIVAYYHRPWFTSNKVHTHSAEGMRKEYEKLFFDHKVDMVLNGHVHAYERTHPVYDYELNTEAPVHITSGHGGNHEGLYNNWITPAPEWSAYREGTSYGFSAFTVYNSSHLHWKMIESDGTVADDWWFIRDH
eukprot:TRINITY_DN5729_c0_g1_i1.p1 TRINITY_DN5729_c0_g1~~TRINITY_DN5729_c0_g1_i1.p1  ORF type:complete len:256 (-),score=49.16 TRINITY_DN5729_c0_g1_i1:30-797(-)